MAKQELEERLMTKPKTIREVLEDFADKCQFSMTTPMEKPELVWTIDRKELTDQALSDIRELMPEKERDIPTIGGYEFNYKSWNSCLEKIERIVG